MCNEEIEAKCFPMKKLKEEPIPFENLPWEITLENILIPIRGLIGGALVLKK